MSETLSEKSAETVRSAPAVPAAGAREPVGGLSTSIRPRLPLPIPVKARKVDAPVEAKAEEAEAKATVSKEDAGDEKEDRPGAEAAPEKKAATKKDKKADAADSDSQDESEKKE